MQARCLRYVYRRVALIVMCFDNARMKQTRSLPVLLPKVTEQRWSCHSCGHCCRSLVIHLTSADRQRIEGQGWKEKLGTEPFVRAGRAWVLNKRENGDCVFLDENTRCRIHAESGAKAKPIACRMFPFSARATRAGWQASLRFDCPSVVSSKGESIGRHRSWLSELVQELAHGEPKDDDVAALGRRVVATPDEIETVMTHLDRWLAGDSFPTPQRLIGAARITTTLAEATFKKVRGPRFKELLDLLFDALPHECAVAPDAPKNRQRGMLRQLAFAHAEHLTLAEMRSGPINRFRKRFHQLSSARRFLSGIGTVPSLPGYIGEATFDAVESATLDRNDAELVKELLRRYVSVRLRERSVFGEGYYGWPVFHGLAAFWLCLATAGWLARYASTLRGVTEVSFADAGFALATVDRAATRLPALGAMAERARVSYLLKDDGPARLLHAYTLVE